MQNIGTGTALKAWRQKEMLLSKAKLARLLEISDRTLYSWEAKGDAELSMDAKRTIRDFLLGQVSKHEHTRMARQAERAAQAKADSERFVREQEATFASIARVRKAEEEREKAEQARAEALRNAPRDPVVASLMEEWGDMGEPPPDDFFKI